MCCRLFEILIGICSRGEIYLVFVEYRDIKYVPAFKILKLDSDIQKAFILGNDHLDPH